MTFREKILLESRVWTLEKESLDAQYFKNLSRRIKPSALWIDSSDNLVSVRELTNTDPGEIIVHRNLACQIRPDDISLLATVEHAIEISGVEVIIICGYSHCSGIRDVVAGTDNGLHVHKWLEELREMYDNTLAKMEKLSARQREKHLCEMNIQRQVLNLSRLDIIQKHWDKGNELLLLGWYFDLTKGSVQEIFSMQERDLLTHVSPVA